MTSKNMVETRASEQPGSEQHGIWFSDSSLLVSACIFVHNSQGQLVYGDGASFKISTR